MTVYSDKTNQDDNTIRNQDTCVEDWMTEIWDWIDNHNIHGSSDSSVPREPEALRRLERLDLGYGKSTSYSYIDNKPVLQSESESTEPLPAAIGHLTNLKYLRLRGFNELPEQIAQLDNLETLVYMNCSFTEFPKVLCKLKNLKSLNIFSKSLKQFPDELGNLSSLTHFDMRGTQVQHLPDAIGNLSKLTSIELYANEDLKALPDSIGNLTNLEKLEVRASDLKTLPSSIGNLKQLKSLGLYQNGLQSLPESITNLKALKQLDVSEPMLLDVSETVSQFLSSVGGKVT
ncbi:leucine-rich repeat domain-containing protein [Psychrobacter sp. F1192]|uniref:Leucine-rich repeat domain-containing protein n=1 Tax=Psychrobacter coccoides TaxID=2818440 RepID=A0ABS3NQ97_9GAMM|nr:leucine-rich repeat domain-containing protein [Psychrobacter coccoides]MBO1531597.1 leucine-rich repeat domain-containing protein [Psychrobacter coccoides]